MAIAKTAIFLCLHPVGMIFLLFHGVVIPLFTFRTRQRDFSSQNSHPFLNDLRIVYSLQKYIKNT
jgi:hypothetical protein